MPVRTMKSGSKSIEVNLDSEKWFIRLKERNLFSQKRIRVTYFRVIKWSARRKMYQVKFLAIEQAMKAFLFLCLVLIKYFGDLLENFWDHVFMLLFFGFNAWLQFLLMLSNNMPSTFLWQIKSLKITIRLNVNVLFI